MSNLATNLTATAEQHPDRPALLFAGRSLTYRELDVSSARVAALLGTLGFTVGDRVGVMLPNVPEFASVYYGVLRAGGVVVPMNVLLKKREVGYYLTDPGAKILFAWHGFDEAACTGATEAGAECVLVEPGAFAGMLETLAPSPEVVERNAEDTAVILYTSGTTGKPKGAELTHANLGRNVEVMTELLSVTADDVILGALPLFHSFGQTAGLNTAIANGASLALVPRFDAGDALEIVEREGVTVFQGVPTMFGAVLNHPRRPTTTVTSLRVCISGGAALPVEVMTAFEAALGCVVLEGYGLSETSPVACFNRVDHVRKAGSIGIPVPGVEMKLLDVSDAGIGEIAIRGHNVMKGYWNRPEATAEALDQDGWFRSGDLAKVDEDGCYFIVDRAKDLIIRGGYNVYPREIEEVLYEHPAVLEAAVIGFEHDELGEEVAAAVVLREDSGVSAEELRAFVQDQVAAYKYPRVLWLADALPKGPTGKILKREIVVPAESLMSPRNKNLAPQIKTGSDLVGNAGSMTKPDHDDVTFLSSGVRCDAWHLRAADDRFAGSAGRPCVVMAHGFGGTRDTGLLDYAAGFAAAGLDVLVFDYRGFGTSQGAPRQRISYRDQRADYLAAIAAARALPGVDPDRIVLWGTSYSGGHVVPVAVADERIAAIVSMTPAMDGAVALLAIARAHPAALLPLVVHGLRDAVRAVFGRSPHHLPIVGLPGSTAVITAPGAFDGYHALAGPTWRNEVCGRVTLEVALNRPGRTAGRLRAPILIQVGEHDAVAPPSAARRAAAKAGRYAEVLNYPVDHFDVYAGDRQRQLLADQVSFISRQLTAIQAPETADH